MDKCDYSCFFHQPKIRIRKIISIFAGIYSYNEAYEANGNTVIAALQPTGYQLRGNKILKKENSIAAYPKHPINDAVLPAIATATTPTSHRPDEAQMHRMAMNKEQKKIKR